MTPPADPRQLAADRAEELRTNLAAHLDTLGYELAARIVREDLKGTLELGDAATREELLELGEALLAGDGDVVIRRART